GPRHLGAPSATPPTLRPSDAPHSHPRCLPGGPSCPNSVHNGYTFDEEAHPRSASTRCSPSSHPREKEPCPPRNHRPSRPADSASPTAATPFSTASTSPCTKARSSPCSAPTAPARPPPSTSCPPSSAPTAARRSSA